MWGGLFFIRQEHVQRLLARIVKAIDNYDEKLQQESTRLKFTCSTKDDPVEDFLTYNKMLDHIKNSKYDDLIEWKFKSIESHEGSLHRYYHNYKGSTHNLIIEWENGEIANEPLNTIEADEPVSCTSHEKENNLLDQPEWTRFKSLEKRRRNSLGYKIKPNLETIELL